MLSRGRTCPKSSVCLTTIGLAPSASRTCNGWPENWGSAMALIARCLWIGDAFPEKLQIFQDLINDCSIKCHLSSLSRSFKPCRTCIASKHSCQTTGWHMHLYVNIIYLYMFIEYIVSAHVSAVLKNCPQATTCGGLGGDDCASRFRCRWQGHRGWFLRCWDRWRWEV